MPASRQRSRSPVDGARGHRDDRGARSPSPSRRRISAVACVAVHARHLARPSAPRRTTLRSSASSASRPSSASSTVYPRCSRMPVATSWLISLSSTTRTRPRPGRRRRGSAVAGALAGAADHGAASAVCAVGTGAPAWSGSRRCRPRAASAWPTSGPEVSSTSRGRAEVRGRRDAPGELEPVHLGHAAGRGRRGRTARRRGGRVAAPTAHRRRCRPRRPACPSAASWSCRISRLVCVVVDDQHPQAGRASPVWRGRRDGGRRPRARAAAVNQKVLPWPGLALDADRAAHRGRRARGRSPARGRCRRTGGWWRRRPARTASNSRGRVLVGDADAGVGDLERATTPRRPSRSVEPGADDDLAARR